MSQHVPFPFLNFVEGASASELHTQNALSQAALGSAIISMAVKNILMGPFLMADFPGHFQERKWLLTYKHSVLTNWVFYEFTFLRARPYFFKVNAL